MNVDVCYRKIAAIRSSGKDIDFVWTRRKCYCSTRWGQCVCLVIDIVVALRSVRIRPVLSFSSSQSGDRCCGDVCISNRSSIRQISLSLWSTWFKLFCFFIFSQHQRLPLVFPWNRIFHLWQRRKMISIWITRIWLRISSYNKSYSTLNNDRTPHVIFVRQLLRRPTLSSCGSQLNRRASLIRC